MEYEELRQVKLEAIMAARDAGARIKVSGDRARVIFDAVWEVVENQLLAGRAEE